MRLVDRRTLRARSLRNKLIDPFGRIIDYSTLTFRSWLKEVLFNVLPPYSFGFGAGQAEVLIRLNAGYTVLRVFVPWWNNPVQSRDLSLLPGDAKEFFAQLEVAYAKWKRQAV
jgi:hypothetical protein